MEMRVPVIVIDDPVIAKHVFHIPQWRCYGVIELRIVTPDTLEDEDEDARDYDEKRALNDYVVQVYTYDAGGPIDSLSLAATPNRVEAQRWFDEHVNDAETDDYPATWG